LVIILRITWERPSRINQFSNSEMPTH